MRKFSFVTLALFCLFLSPKISAREFRSHGMVWTSEVSFLIPTLKGLESMHFMVGHKSLRIWRDTADTTWYYVSLKRPLNLRKTIKIQPTKKHVWALAEEPSVKDKKLKNFFIDVHCMLDAEEKQDYVATYAPYKKK